jgi:uncharacterized membrane protein
MEAHLIDFLGMLVRWLHVVAGICWIGSSFYFVWLDNSLDAPEPDSEEARKGVSGELWAVHGGGFYNPQKYGVAPAKLPEKLHWFMWEAYTTWLTGTALLVLVYWLNAGTMMVDPSVAAISPRAAVGIGALSMVGSWVVYDLICRSPLRRHNGVIAVLVFGLLTLLAYALCGTLGGRAAYIHVGTSIGTIMAANVFFVIIPNQRKMVKAMKAGLLPDPEDGKRGKQRSVHNNYFTLPVVFIMVSNHYSATFGHPHAWAVLTVIAGSGVLIRHFFNRKHKGVYAWPYLAAGGVLLAAVAVWTAPHVQPLPKVEGPVTFDRVKSIIGQRCVTCHSQSPTFPGITQPPAGVILQGTDNVLRNAQRVYQQVIVTRIMPLGNATQMTEQERAVIAAWVTSGAPAQ